MEYGANNATGGQQQQQYGFPTQSSNNTTNNNNTQSTTTSSAPPPQIDAAKIFVGGLSWQTTEEILRYHFEQYGEVVSVEVMRDRQTGDPRGFAFVVFRTDDTVELVLKSGPHEINHKLVDVKRAQARGVAPPSIHFGAGGEGGEGGAGGGVGEGQGHRPKKTQQHGNNDNAAGGGGGNNNSNLSPEQLKNKVFVGGLPLTVDRDELRIFFSQYGTVVDAIVMMDMVQRRSRGFGFVTFENGSRGAQKALEAQPLTMQGKYVEVKLATPKGDREPGGGGGGGGGGGFQKGLRNPMGGGAGGGGGEGAGGGPGGGAGGGGMTISQNSGEFAGLAASYGRNGWRAGYGTQAFGSFGWGVVGWEEGGSRAPERSGFSFKMLEKPVMGGSGSKRERAGSAGGDGGRRDSKRQRQ